MIFLRHRETYHKFCILHRLSFKSKIPKTIVDDDGNNKYLFSDFKRDENDTHGVKYIDEYYYQDGSDIDTLIKKVNLMIMLQALNKMVRLMYYQDNLIYLLNSNLVPYHQCLIIKLTSIMKTVTYSQY